MLIGRLPRQRTRCRHRAWPRTLAALHAAGVELQRVALGPLQVRRLDALVADTLALRAQRRPSRWRGWCTQKTGGNPFFVIQFLKMLERDGLLRFDDHRAALGFRIDAIADAPLADNVVDLMTRNIQRLRAEGAVRADAGGLHRQPLRSRDAGDRQRTVARRDRCGPGRRRCAEGLIVQVAQRSARQPAP